MNVGQVIAALAKLASDFDGDPLLLSRYVYSIEVVDGQMEISFVDGNTDNVIVDRHGKLVGYWK